MFDSYVLRSLTGFIKFPFFTSLNKEDISSLRPPRKRLELGPSGAFMLKYSVVWIFLLFVLVTKTTQANYRDFRLQIVKSWFCKTSGCSDNSKAPDAVQFKKIALTFDDGPNPETTPKILAVLKKHNIKATFFVLGKNVESNHSLLRKIVSDGHIVGSHSWNHPSFWKLTSNEISHQINDTENALLEAGIRPRYFRYPHGNSTSVANGLLRAKRYKVVGWHVDTCDWGFNENGVLSAANNQICNGSEKTVTNAFGYLLGKIQSRKGGIVLMHDTMAITARYLDRILENLEAQGYEFVTLDNTDVFPLLNQ